jgi:hypothetical protein
VANPEIDPRSAFRYRRVPLERRHGPGGYSDYRSFRPWLRDEFAFRCVYCLIREQWGRISGEFDLDHFAPQVSRPDLKLEYDNLLYVCGTCNVRKGSRELPDPSQVLTSVSVRILPDGTITGLTADADRIIRLLCLNSPGWIRWRRTWIRIIELAAENDFELLQDLLGFPEDLPNLAACRAPRNSRAEGIDQSFFARRERGELPELFVGE